MKNRSSWWLCIVALALTPLSAQADRGSGDDDGVPFRLLQQQLDALTRRVGALEAARAPGQSCQAGQFVAAITATGVIVCAAPATAGGTGVVDPTLPPPPPPALPPIPDTFRAALQQAFSAMSGSNLQVLDILGFETLVPGAAAVMPTTYDLTIGTVVIAQTSATSATIMVAVPTFVLRGNYSLDAGGQVIIGSLTMSASPGMTVTIDVPVAQDPNTGKRFFAGQPSFPVLHPEPLTVTGTDPAALAAQVAASPSTLLGLNDQIRNILRAPVLGLLVSLPQF